MRQYILLSSSVVKKSNTNFFMSFIIGKKVKMDRVWNEKGVPVPVTIINAGPVVVTQIKSPEKDGYKAIQVGYDQSIKKITKSLAGHFKDNGKFRYTREFKNSLDKEYVVGESIDVSTFVVGDKLRVTGFEKGRGFQGVVKRHGFHGGPKTHGQKNRHRAPGSLGPTAPQRVVPGKKMAGRMGNDKVTLRNVKVVSVDKENNIIAIKGQAPGSRKGILLIEKM